LENEILITTDKEGILQTPSVGTKPRDHLAESSRDRNGHQGHRCNPDIEALVRDGTIRPHIGGIVSSMI
jgi:hypothetical protein